jgi:hypothetical protein
MFENDDIDFYREVNSPRMGINIKLPVLGLYNREEIISKDTTDVVLNVK